MFKPRILLSIVRTLIYCFILTFLSFKRGEKWDLLNAALIGGTLSDNVMSLIRSLLYLPVNILHGAYDSCISILCCWYVLKTIVPTADLQGQDMGIAFIAFLMVVGINTTRLCVSFLSNDYDGSDDDDEEDPMLKV